MKKLLFVILLSLGAIISNAQFTSAVLQASGLTCAMCTKAIFNALDKIPSIETVNPDIKNSAFHIVFKSNVPVDIDALKDAVEDAGFSVAKLKMTGNFTKTAVKNDEHVKINGKTFHFLNVHNQTLNGEKEITLVDKHFLTAKEFKKFSQATDMQCVQTGKAADCCKKEGIAEHTRIYHVTI